MAVRTFARTLVAVRTFARTLAPVFTLVLLLAGCGSVPDVPLPAKPAAAASVASQATPGPAHLSARSQALAAYIGYWRAYGAATRTRNMAAARKLLAAYTDAAFLSEVTAPLQRLWAGHDIGYGFAVPHVLSFTRTGPSAALLHDCLDLSHLGTQDIRTGRIMPGSYGLPTLNFYVTLLRAAGPPSGGQSGRQRVGKDWVVSKMLQVEVPCTP
jgi:hypothetical protein